MSTASQRPSGGKERRDSTASSWPSEITASIDPPNDYPPPRRQSRSSQRPSESHQISVYSSSARHSSAQPSVWSESGHGGRPGSRYSGYPDHESVGHRESSTPAAEKTSSRRSSIWPGISSLLSIRSGKSTSKNEASARSSETHQTARRISQSSRYSGATNEKSFTSPRTVTKAEAPSSMYSQSTHEGTRRASSSSKHTGVPQEALNSSSRRTANEAIASERTLQASRSSRHTGVVQADAFSSSRRAPNEGNTLEKTLRSSRHTAAVPDKPRSSSGRPAKEEKAREDTHRSPRHPAVVPEKHVSSSRRTAMTDEDMEKTIELMNQVLTVQAKREEAEKLRESKRAAGAGPRPAMAPQVQQERRGSVAGPGEGSDAPYSRRGSVAQSIKQDAYGNDTFHRQESRQKVAPPARSPAPRPQQKVRPKVSSASLRSMTKGKIPFLLRPFVVYDSEEDDRTVVRKRLDSITGKPSLYLHRRRSDAKPKGRVEEPEKTGGPGSYRRTSMTLGKTPADGGSRRGSLTRAPMQHQASQHPPSRYQPSHHSASQHLPSQRPPSQAAAPASRRASMSQASRARSATIVHEKAEPLLPSRVGGQLSVAGDTPGARSRRTSASLVDRSKGTVLPEFEGPGKSSKSKRFSLFK